MAATCVIGVSQQMQFDGIVQESIHDVGQVALVKSLEPLKSEIL